VYECVDMCVQVSMCVCGVYVHMCLRVCNCVCMSVCVCT